MDIEKLPDQIVDSIVNNNLSASAIDLSEIGIDKLLDETFLSDFPIPIFNTVIKSIRVVMHIRDKIFLAKVVKFFLCLDSISIEDKKAFKRKMEEDSKFKKKVGETLLLILERLDDLAKPEIIAKVFKAFLSGKITFSDFQRVALAVDIAYIDDLRMLIGQPVDRPTFDWDYMENLLRTGLVKIGNVETPMFPGRSAGEISYELSPMGYLFEMIMRDRWPLS